LSTRSFLDASPHQKAADRAHGTGPRRIHPERRGTYAVRLLSAKPARARLITDVVAPSVLGITCALAAWSPGHSPAVGLLLPLLWALSPSRLAAFMCIAAYAMTVVRFLPDFAGTWFASPAFGWLCWIGVGVASGGLWAMLWPRRSSALPVARATMAALIISLLPPAGALFPGHPVVCFGFALPGSGWIGIAAMTFATATAAAVLRAALTQPRGIARAWLALAGASVALALFGLVPESDAGQRAGNVVGMRTAWGGFPPYGSFEVTDRLRRIGATLDALAPEGPLTLVYPEAILGLYDASLNDVIELEITRRIRRTGQTIVLGANVDDGGGRFRNIALVLHPDGSRSIVAARQTTPVAQWRPWSGVMDFPSDWLASSTVTVSANIGARIMFCHEEWMPALHLLAEAREKHLVVIAMANLWAAEAPSASYVQGAHTEGVARLFGRQFVRAVNITGAQRQPG
jgi:hypothetical protein